VKFRTPKLKLTLLMVVLSALIPTVWAQTASRSIIFSTPDGDAGQSGKSSLEPVNPQLVLFHDTAQAPMQFFNFSPPNDPSPAPVSPVLFPQQRMMQKLLEERQNWILMTPEEILGVTTTEKMLQPPERDALGNEIRPTQLERFLQRERQVRNSPTNGWRNDRAGSTWNFEHNPDSGDQPDFGHDNPAEAARDFSRLLNGQRNHDEAVAPRQNSFRDTAGQPLSPVTARSDQDQLAAMDRFRQLLNPSPVEPSQPSQDGQLFMAPKPAVDPFLTRPDFIPNPAGASFTPLSSGIAKPTGLTPLPDAVSSLLPSVTAPARKTQPPPWLLQGPQPFVISQPKGY
jgi:hypothetical protein